MKSEVDMDKQNREYYKSAFHEVHAPEALAGKVRDMTEKTWKKEEKRGYSAAKRMAVTAATLALVLAGSNGLVYAATGSTWMGGIFSDITNFTGAVVGTEYVQATEEVSISITEAVIEEGDVLLTLDMDFLYKDKAPYKYLEQVSVTDVIIVDVGGREIPVQVAADCEESPSCAITTEGGSSIQLRISDPMMKKAGNYTMRLESFWGMSKADAPVEIKGSWSCGFTVE